MVWTRIPAEMARNLLSICSYPVSEKMGNFGGLIWVANFGAFEHAFGRRFFDCEHWAGPKFVIITVTTLTKP